MLSLDGKTILSKDNTRLLSREIPAVVSGRQYLRSDVVGGHRKAHEWLWPLQGGAGILGREGSRLLSHPPVPDAHLTTFACCFLHLNCSFLVPSSMKQGNNNRHIMWISHSNLTILCFNFLVFNMGLIRACFGGALWVLNEFIVVASLVHGNPTCSILPLKMTEWMNLSLSLIFSKVWFLQL